MLRKALLIMMLLVCSPAVAGTVSVDALFPHPFISAPEGSGELSVSVEDLRSSAVLGQTAQGDALQFAGDIAQQLRDFIADDLNQAGYVVLADGVISPRHLSIKLEQVKYSASSGFFKSALDVNVVLSVYYQDGDVARSHTFDSHVWQEVALKPSLEESGKVIGQALADAVRAMFSEQAVKSYLAKRGGGSGG